MLICIICKNPVLFYGGSTHYTLCLECSYESLNDDQKKILEEQRTKSK
ncbi:MAG: hypothetical protein V3V33_07030 [Candidatus Lokiarchaeia archaeon]